MDPDGRALTLKKFILPILRAYGTTSFFSLYSPLYHQYPSGRAESIESTFVSLDNSIPLFWNTRLFSLQEQFSASVALPTLHGCSEALTNRLILT